MTFENFSPTEATLDDLSRLIFDYLHQHPEAGDTLEGIARWWVLRQQLDETIQQVQGALRELKARGLVVECRTPDRRTFYFACDGPEH